MAPWLAHVDRLVDDSTAALLRTSQGGAGRREAALSELEVGMWCQVEARIVQIHPSRTYNRRQGGPGLVTRLVLADASGEMDLVLWDDEAAPVRDGTWASRDTLVLHGPTVTRYKDKCELTLRSCPVDVIRATPASRPSAGPSPPRDPRLPNG